MGEEITAAREEEEEEEKRDQSCTEEGGTSPSSLSLLNRSIQNRNKKIEKKRREIGLSIGKRDIKANFVFLPRTIVLTLRYIIYII